MESEEEMRGGEGRGDGEKRETAKEKKIKEAKRGRIGDTTRLRMGEMGRMIRLNMEEVIGERRGNERR